MCGRFAQFNPKDLLRETFCIDHITCEIKPSYNIVPSHTVLCIIRHNGLRLGALRWGFIPAFLKNKTGQKAVINARAETVSEKPFFKHSFRNKRCLIIADGFYEWKKSGTESVPHFCCLPDQSPFAFAGIWESWTSEDGEKTATCAIITRQAQGVCSEIHHRMPAIFKPEIAGEWIDDAAGSDMLNALMVSKTEDRLKVYPVSKHVNNPGANDPVCIHPL